MLVFGVVAVDDPFLQLSVTTNLHGSDVLHLELQVLSKQAVPSQHLRSLQRLAEHVESYLVVHR